MNFLADLLQMFIPTERNDYKPHFFRTKAIITLALSIGVLSLGAFGLQKFLISNHDYLAAVIASALVDLANDDRSMNGLTELRMSPELEHAARLKAADMASKSYFAHTSPEGINPWHWFREAGYEFSYAGENLAVRFSDSVDVERAWMNSPTHRANILNSQFTEIGIATAEGMYEGEPAIFVVQEFGRPSVPIPSTSRTNVGTTSTASLASEVIPATTTSVAGATLEEIELEVVEAPVVIIEDETFIAVRSVPETVPGVAAVTSSNATFPIFQKILTSPRTLLNTIFAVLGAIIAFALALFVGIEPKRQYPLHVFLGVLLILLMASLLFAWEALAPGTLIL